MKKSRKPPPDFACLGGSHDRSKSVAPVARWDITLYNRTLHFSRLRSISAFNTHSLFLPRPPLPPLEKLRNRSLVRKQVPIKTSTTKKKKKNTCLINSFTCESSRLTFCGSLLRGSKVYTDDFNSSGRCVEAEQARILSCGTIDSHVHAVSLQNHLAHITA